MLVSEEEQSICRKSRVHYFFGLLYTRVHAARGDMEDWWSMFKETVDYRYDDEVELAVQIGEYFETV